MKEAKNHNEMLNDEELEKLAPSLFGMKRESPFKVPEGYFDSLADNMILQIQNLPDFESVAKENHFVIPGGYFDSLPTIIQERIIAGTARKFSITEWILQNFFQPKYILAFASVALIVVFGARYMTRTISVDYYSSLTIAEISNSGYLADIDENLIVEQLGSLSLNNTNSSDKGDEDYLIDNDIDLNTLSEQIGRAHV